jgi:hypothetical protein
LSHTVWRIATDTPTDEAGDLSGIGAKSTGGRWNAAGMAIVYPPAISSTGAGWATGAGRIGTIAGPLLAGCFYRLAGRGSRSFCSRPLRR